MRFVRGRPRRLGRGPRGIGFCGIDAPGFDVESVGRLRSHDDVHSDIHYIDGLVDYLIDDGTAFQLLVAEHSLLQSRGNSPPHGHRLRDGERGE